MRTRVSTRAPDPFSKRLTVLGASPALSARSRPPTKRRPGHPHLQARNHLRADKDAAREWRPPDQKKLAAANGLGNKRFRRGWHDSLRLLADCRGAPVPERKRSLRPVQRGFAGG
jgi:hypothetical protein